MLAYIAAHIVALIQMAPTPVNGDVFSWVVESIKWIVHSLQNHEYGPAISGIIMVLVYIFNTYFKGKVSSKALPWVSVGVGLLLAVGTKLSALAVGAKPMDWLTTITAGIMAGASASGLWSLVGKQVSSALEKKPAASQTPPAATPPTTPGA